MNVKTVQNRLRRRAVTLRRGKQSGFTLLELLVVVAILAAIAGTATIALQDTDARAAAAAHVAMMDELNKGIRTYRVLRGNEYPDSFDSLLERADAGSAPALLGNLGTGDLALVSVPTGTPLNDIGLNNLRIVQLDQDPPDAGNCTDLQALINNRGNAVVAGNLYLSTAANGCGVDYALDSTAGSESTVAVWSGGQERVLGNDAVEVTAAQLGGTGLTAAEEGAKMLMAVGVGPSSSLFDGELASLTSVPIYRHVAQDEYNRFIALFHIGTVDDTATAGTFVWEPVDQVSLVTIVDGAGDTKEEELGEWDGTRNTI